MHWERQNVDAQQPGQSRQESYSGQPSGQAAQDAYQKIGLNAINAEDSLTRVA